MGQDIYQRLRERIDEYALAFPATQSGVEMKILQRLFCLSATVETERDDRLPA